MAGAVGDDEGFEDGGDFFEVMGPAAMGGGREGDVAEEFAEGVERGGG